MAEQAPSIDLPQKVKKFIGNINESKHMPYKVVCDASNNPPESIARGELNVTIVVPTPLIHLIVEIDKDGKIQFPKVPDHAAGADRSDAVRDH